MTYGDESSPEDLGVSDARDGLGIQTLDGLRDEGFDEHDVSDHHPQQCEHDTPPREQRHAPPVEDHGDVLVFLLIVLLADQTLTWSLCVNLQVGRQCSRREVRPL